MAGEPTAQTRLLRRLEEIYGRGDSDWPAWISRLLEHHPPAPAPQRPPWDEREVLLIAYGDHIREAGVPPLRALQRFLQVQRADELFRTLHLLPFFPSSSDDGFSVVDYRAVEPALGGWDEIRALADSFGLMFDLVLNHVSRQSDWFQQYLRGREPYLRYFLEVDPACDLTAVARPRSLPLLTEFATSRGPRHLWTTFSADQVDLNYACPQVLFEMAEIVLEYVRRGARILRLDAIAYLWKQVGTDCLHRPQTHAVVRFFRELLDLVAPHVLLLTETNVPHEENVSYFGQGDEAHLVYQFSLPPLLLDAILQGDARPLTAWLAGLAQAPPGTTYLNFTASHDGVGVRPLEGLVSETRFQQLVEATLARGGLYSTRRRPDGSDAPYELNITYFDACSAPGDPGTPEHISRFLATQAVMLALRGIPGVYLPSLFGGGNDLAGVQQSGQARRINRRKYDAGELAQTLGDRTSLAARVLRGYRQMLAVRIRQPAFHPDAGQEVWDDAPPAVVAVLRTCLDQRQQILVLANVSGVPQSFDWSLHGDFRPREDLLSGRRWPDSTRVELAPYQVLWLSPQARLPMDKGP